MFSDEERRFQQVLTYHDTAEQIRRHGINNHRIALGESRWAFGDALAEDGERKLDRLFGRILRKVYRRYGL